MSQFESTIVRPEPPDRLDELLRQFYRAELPAPWPASPATAEVKVAAPRSRWSLWNSRAALAASILLLLLGHLLLSGHWRQLYPERLPRAPHDVAAKPFPRPLGQ